MVICFWSFRLMWKITEIKSIYGYFLTLNLSLSYSLCSSCKIDMYTCYKLAIYTLYINNPTCLSIDSTWDASSGRAQSPKKTFVSYTRGSFFFLFLCFIFVVFLFRFFSLVIFFFFHFCFMLRLRQLTSLTGTNVNAKNNIKIN